MKKTLILFIVVSFNIFATGPVSQTLTFKLSLLKALSLSLSTTEVTFSERIVGNNTATISGSTVTINVSGGTASDDIKFYIDSDGTTSKAVTLDDGGSNSFDVDLALTSGVATLDGSGVASTTLTSSIASGALSSVVAGNYSGAVDIFVEYQ